MLNKLLVLVGVLVAVGLGLSIESGDANAAGVPGCQDSNEIDIIYVRGSGESYSGEFFSKLPSALEKNLNQNDYRLTELNPILLDKVLPEYTAVGVSTSFQEIANGLTAVLSYGEMGRYSASLDSGVNLLTAYLEELSRRPGECVVLIGYSQGAHVIGAALDELAGSYPGVMNRILYVGLLGDPKLDLKGEGLSLSPDLPWYRGNATPLINGGLLGSRRPYLPKIAGQYFSPVGSWCYDDDIVCTENYLTASSTGAHGKYPERAFRDLSLEISVAVHESKRLTKVDPASLSDCKSVSQDIVVLLDTSPLMRRDHKLFSSSPLYDPYHQTASGLKLPPRTAGQMLLGNGCGDSRLAVVTYGREEDGPPILALDFTSNPLEYDRLVESLYEDKRNGTYSRTQFREAAVKAMGLSWREDASRSIFALTDIAGSGGEWGSGGTASAEIAKQFKYKNEPLTKEVLALSTEKRVPIWGVPVMHSYSGYLPSVGKDSWGDVRSYLNMFSDATGAYNWVKAWPNYGEYNFKLNQLHTTLNQALSRVEGVMVNVAPVAARVGDSVTVEVRDTLGTISSAKLRNETVGYRWHVDCNDLTRYVYTNHSSYTFIPQSAQNCTGFVTVSLKKVNNNGCYVGCPEPFPPYVFKPVYFAVSIKPASYQDQLPEPIINLKKYVFDDRTSISWDAPSHNPGEVRYVIRETDGNILGITASRELVITDTDGDDPDVTIEAASIDGASEPVSSREAETVDMRSQPEIVIERPWPWRDGKSEDWNRGNDPLRDPETLPVLAIDEDIVSSSRSSAGNVRPLDPTAVASISVPEGGSVQINNVLGQANERIDISSRDKAAVLQEDDEADVRGVTAVAIVMFSTLLAVVLIARKMKKKAYTY